MPRSKEDLDRLLKSVQNDYTFRFGKELSLCELLDEVQRISKERFREFVFSHVGNLSKEDYVPLMTLLRERMGICMPVGISVPIVKLDIPEAVELNATETPKRGRGRPRRY